MKQTNSRQQSEGPWKTNETKRKVPPASLALISLLLVQAVLLAGIAPVNAALNVNFVPSAATTAPCVTLQGSVPCKTQFTATVGGSTAFPITVKFDLGDNGVVEDTCTISSGNKCRVAIGLTVAGTFPVRVTATDRNGVPGEAVHDLIVTPAPPIAIIPSVVGLSPRLNVGDQFSVNVHVGNSTNPMNDLDAWQIIVGYDPNIVTAVGPSCGAQGGPPCTAADYGAEPPFDTYAVYSSPGIDDAQGRITVGATFVQFPDVGPSGFGNFTRIDFVVRASGSSPLSLSSVALRSVVITTIQSINPSRSDDGFFTNIATNPPIASFSVSPGQFQRLIGTLITFDASNSRDVDGFIANYTWNFADGNTTTVTFPIITHVFNEPKTYSVILTVTDNTKLNGTTSQNIAIQPAFTVKNLPPTAFFSTYLNYTTPNPIPTTKVKVGEVVSFDAFGSQDPEGCIVQFRWNFGDGFSQVLPDPAGGCLDLDPNLSAPLGEVVNHTYTQDGKLFSATLVVVDNASSTSAAFSNPIQVGELPKTSTDYSTWYYSIGGGAAVVAFGIGFLLRRRRARLKAAEDLAP